MTAPPSKVQAAAFTQFVRDQSAALRRIARATRGALSDEEMAAETWLIAPRIAERRGYPIDFNNPRDQSEILAWLTNEHVKYARRGLRNTVSINQRAASEDRDNAAGLPDVLLTAPENADPLVYLQELEDEENLASAVRSSYSELSAYVLFLAKFSGQRSRAASYLGISVSTFKKRFERAAEIVSRQRSLFDGIAFIDPEFIPRPGRWKISCFWLWTHKTPWRFWVVKTA